MCTGTHLLLPFILSIIKILLKGLLWEKVHRLISMCMLHVHVSMHVWPALRAHTHIELAGASQPVSSYNTEVVPLHDHPPGPWPLPWPLATGSWL